MLEILDKGGVILWIIMGLSVVAALIIIERLIYFRKIRGDEEKMIGRIKSVLAKGHFDEALSILEMNPSPIANLMKVGLEYRNFPPETIKDMILDAANLEVPKIERNIPLLGTITYIAPLLGLLGTVTGNIKAFGVISRLGAVGDPGLLARGIAEALLTTVGGLVVAIPAIVFYNYLVNRVNHGILRMETRVNELVILLGGNKHEIQTKTPAQDNA